MAVYTDVSFEELDRFLQSYDVGAARSFKGIAEGVENTNFHLQTDRGSYVLTLYEKRVSADDLPFFLNLMHYLAERGSAGPQPGSNREGERWAGLNGKPAALLTFRDGVSVRMPEASHCAQAGKALAKLHRAGSDFSGGRQNALGPEGWRKLAAETQTNADTVQAGLALLIQSTIGELDAWPSGLPSGIIHADLFPDNVLFLNGEISGLIDFYFA